MNNTQIKLIIILIIFLCDINYAYYILDTSYINNFTNNTNNTNISNHLYSNDNKKSLIVITTIIFISGVISGIWEYC
jgi:hypothetical protein